MKFLRTQNASQKGFTLLLAALVASITLSLGAAIYSIAIKQLALSSIGRDSQFAFYTADTLAECTLYNDIRLDLFPTSTVDGTYLPGTPPNTFTCNGVSPVNVVVDQEDAASSGSACTFTTAGGSGGQCSGTTFTVPAVFTQLTVRIEGAGGGGGSGRTAGSNGNNGVPGTSRTSFTHASYGELYANRGTHGGGGTVGCSAPPPPHGGGGTVSAGGDAGSGQGLNLLSGGGGGAGVPCVPSANGLSGNGGNGGLYIKTFSSNPSDPNYLAPGSTAAIVVGTGGAGGASAGSGSSPGSSGSNGRIEITWTGPSSSWGSTEFSFQLDFNNDCGRVTLTKRRNALGYIENRIHADGLNVSCASYLTDPHALQRSVELLY